MRGVLLGVLVGALLFAPGAEAAKLKKVRAKKANAALTARACRAGQPCQSWEQACRKTGRRQVRCVSRTYYEGFYCVWNTRWVLKRKVVRRKKRKRVRFVLRHRSQKPSCVLTPAPAAPG